MTAYSDYSFRRDAGLSETEMQVESSVEIEREQGDVSYQPSSVDLHVASGTRVMNEQRETIHLDDESTYPSYTEPDPYDGRLYVPSDGFVLATTQETVNLDDSVVGYLWGRSSLGRLGVFAHNAGLVDAGYEGELTLELTNVSPNRVAIPVGSRVAQLTVHKLTTAAQDGYDDRTESKYNEQTGPTPSRMFEDFGEDG